MSAERASRPDAISARVRWGVLLVAVALVAAACAPPGGGGAAPDGTGEDAPITLGFSAWPGWFPWQVTEEAGIFEQVGVEVELRWFEGYLDSINALAVGQLDANSQTLNDTLTSAAAGAEQVIVLVNDNSTGNDQIIAREGINSIADLKGARIGVEVGVVDHYLLLLGLQSAGLAGEDVELVNLETAAAAAQFASGTDALDAVAVFAPSTTRALSRSGSKTLFSSADFPGAIPDHLVVSAQLARDNPEGVQGLVDAWFATLDFIETNPERALEIMARRAGVSVEEYRAYDAGTSIFSIEENLKAFEPGDDITSLRGAADRISGFLLDSELVTRPPDLDPVFEPRFVRDYARRHGVP